MNTENDEIHFDRLVDGELNENERRELLTRLDAEPSGWRRCALAFLEAQCWKETLRGVAQDSGAALARTIPLDTRRSPWPGRIGTALAMSASFFLAVWLGSLMFSNRDGQPSSPTGLGNPTMVAENADLQPPTQPIPSNDDLRAKTPRENTPSNPWQIVTVSSPSNGLAPGRSFNVPAVERDKLDEQWMRSLPPAIPNNVLEALTRTGHEIRQHREFVPVPLKDGRQMVMPVDQVEVHYVGNGSY